MTGDPGSGGAAFLLPVGEGPDGAILGLLAGALESGAVDALLLPVPLPAGDSFAWILTRDPAVAAGGRPLPPVMPVQGARALRDLTRKGESDVRILALMRPCEIRAARELAKLGQVRTDGLLLASWDCPGALCSKDHVADPDGAGRRFAGMIAAGSPDAGGGVRSSCPGCVDFSMTDADVHFGLLGEQDGALPVMAGSPAGRTLLGSLGLTPAAGTARWKLRAEMERERRETSRRAADEAAGSKLRGAEGLLSFFSACIGCRICRAVCPICHCRLCHFDSETPRPDPDAFFDGAELRGGASLPANRLLFHVGRMTHMSLSCVSCGQCSDACPAGIPVADAFGFVGRAAREAFGYEAGRGDGIPHPLRTWRRIEPDGIGGLVRDAEPGACAHE